VIIFRCNVDWSVPSNFAVSLQLRIMQLMLNMFLFRTFCCFSSMKSYSWSTKPD